MPTRLLFCIGLLLGALGLQGAHLVGGEISYRCLGNNQYEVKLVIYRDCAGNGAPFDDPAIITAYRDNGQLQGNYLVSLLQQRRLPNSSNDPCNSLPNFVCTQEGIYLDTIVLPAGRGYTLSHQRCCRNNSINNIPNPGDWGNTYTIEVPNLSACNSSPSFAVPPPVALCLNQSLDLDMSAQETDGDSLSYALCDLFHGGGPVVNNATAGGPNSPRPDTATPPPYTVIPFWLGFSAQNPLAGNPGISINPQTGRLSGRPSQVGQYVFAICVNEWRNGQIISTLRRDFQFNVSSACTKTMAGIKPQDNDSIRLCQGLELQFEEDCYNTQRYHWDFGVPNRQDDTSNLARPRFSFPDTGIYRVRLIANPGDPCADTAYRIFKVYEDIQARFSVEGDFCFDQHQIHFFAGGNFGPEAEFRWDFGAQTNRNRISSVQDPQGVIYPAEGNYLVRLEIREKGCLSVFEDWVRIFRRPVLGHIVPRVDGCAPVTVQFRDTSKYALNLQHFWDFGDGNTSTEPSPLHRYEQGGIYSVYHEVRSESGCIDSLSEAFPDHILVRPAAEPRLYLEPERLTLADGFIDISDSTSAESKRWLLLPDGQSLENIDQYRYEVKDTGYLVFRLVAENELGCRDTSFKSAYVEEPLAVFIPNAFRPEGQAPNNRFRFSALGLEAVEIVIFNRWGSRVWNGKGREAFWDGRLDNGELAPSGVYTYQLRAYAPSQGREIFRNGTVRLIR